MADESRQHRVKKTGAATHRTGTLRAAVKPGVLSNESAQASTGTNTASTSNTASSSSAGKLSLKSLILDYMNALPAGSTSQTAWGDKLALVEKTLRTNYQLPATDELYLLLDLNRTGAGETGMVLSSSGLHLNGGTGGRVSMSWQEFKQTTVGISQGLLVIGQSGISTPDAQVIAQLLQHLQSKLAH